MTSSALEFCTWGGRGMVVWDVDRIRARLSALAGADPECLRFGAARHRYRLGPVLTERQVATFERENGITFPEEHRTFLIDVGHGGAGPYYGLLRLDEAVAQNVRMEDWVIPGSLAIPFPHAYDWNPYLEREYEDPRWTTGSLTIAEFGCGAYHRLVITGPERGRVWFDDRGSDGGLIRERAFHDWYMDWLTHFEQRTASFHSR